MPTLGRFLFLVAVTVHLLAGNLALAQPAPHVHAPAGLTDPAPAAGANNYQMVPVDTMIDLLEALSGKHYIRDANLKGVAPISVNVEGLTKEDSIRLITSTLLLNGVAIIPTDDHTMKVLTLTTNKNPRSEGLRVYTNAADLPADDEIVAYSMALDHIDPQEAAGIFVQVAPPHTYGAYVASPSAQGIILIENASVIRELIELKKSIDIAKEPNVRPPPPEPRGPGDSRPPGPPHHHPIARLLGLLLLSAFMVVIVAAGNVFAHRWLNRGGTRVP